MNMIFRWYGEGNDSISLGDIRQIPGVSGVCWSLHDKVAGEEWEMERIQAVKDLCDKQGLSIDVVESVNVHDDIKIGKPSRDKYIDIYIDTIKKLASVGVKVICYNFMPVFDWTRTDLFKELPDGSNALFYEKNKIHEDYKEMVANILAGAKNFTMPGWEPERLAQLDTLFKDYQGVTEEILTENLKYFLERIIPVCEEHDVKMAIHPDDPPWPIFGLPRIVRSREHIERLLNLVDSPCNGLALCTGSLGANPDNDIPALIREYSDRIHFAHIRNVKVFENGDFIETSHRAQDGSLDMVDIIKAYHEADFKGYIRPDHGRHLWGEEKHCRPGYGLYDRALGIMYMLGIWDTLDKQR